ncbi:MAG: type III pantothenate kinase [Thermoguttaceae bacterium]
MFVAVDVGNNRLKFGLFAAGVAREAAVLPEPIRTLALSDDGTDLRELAGWLAESESGALRWWIGSVNRSSATLIIDWLHQQRPKEPITLLAAGDLPLEVHLNRPDMVGIDRLLDAVAGNRLRQPGHLAVLVDVGSAITVDLVSAEGAFLGGAILPGLAMSARALHAFTDLLPRVELSDLNAPPPALGTGTVAAMQSGLFWGAVGAIRELTERLTAGAAGPVDVFLTGGAGPAVADLLGKSIRQVPHLTLAGIALTAIRES